MWLARLLRHVERRGWLALKGLLWRSLACLSLRLLLDVLRWVLWQVCGWVGRAGVGDRLQKGARLRKKRAASRRRDDDSLHSSSFPGRQASPNSPSSYPTTSPIMCLSLFTTAAPQSLTLSPCSSSSRTHKHRQAPSSQAFRLLPFSPNSSSTTRPPLPAKITHTPPLLLLL